MDEKTTMSESVTFVLQQHGNGDITVKQVNDKKEEQDNEN
jgi:hypothetical protein